MFQCKSGVPFGIDQAKCMAVVACGLSLTWSAGAEPISDWNLSGPGDTSISGTALAPSFEYDLSPSFSGTWTATATAQESGTFYYDWDYRGHHSFFRVRVFLNSLNPAATLVNEGP